MIFVKSFALISLMMMKLNNSMKEEVLKVEITMI